MLDYPLHVRDVPGTLEGLGQQKSLHHRNNDGDKAGVLVDLLLATLFAAELGQFRDNR